MSSSTPHGEKEVSELMPTEQVEPLRRPLETDATVDGVAEPNG